VRTVAAEPNETGETVSLTGEIQPRYQADLGIRRTRIAALNRKSRRNPLPDIFVPGMRCQHRHQCRVRSCEAMAVLCGPVVFRSDIAKWLSGRPRVKPSDLFCEQNRELPSFRDRLLKLELADRHPATSHPPVNARAPSLGVQELLAPTPLRQRGAGTPSRILAEKLGSASASTALSWILERSRSFSKDTLVSVAPRS
jgi:hypothetical protein